MSARRAKGKVANKILAIACSLGLIATMIPGYQLQSFGADLATDTSETEAVVTQDETQAQEPAEEVDASAQTPETEIVPPQDEDALPEPPVGKSADTKKDAAVPKSQGLQLFDEPEPEYELVFKADGAPYTWTEEATALLSNDLNGPSEDLVLRKVGEDSADGVTLDAGGISAYLTWAYDSPAESPVTITSSSIYDVVGDCAYYYAEIEVTPTFDYEKYNEDYPLDTIDYDGGLINSIQVTFNNEIPASPNSDLIFTLESSAANSDGRIYYNSEKETSIPLILTQANNSDPYIPITGIEWQAYNGIDPVGVPSPVSSNLLTAPASYNEVVEQRDSDAGFAGTLVLQVGDAGVSSIAADVTLASGAPPIQPMSIPVMEDNVAPEVTVALSATPGEGIYYQGISGTVTVVDDNYEPQTDGFSLSFVNNSALELSYDSDEQQYTFAMLPDGSYTMTDIENALKEAIANDRAFQDKAGNTPNADATDDISVNFDSGFDPGLDPSEEFIVDTTLPKIKVSLLATEGKDTHYRGMGGTVIVTELNYSEAQLNSSIALALDEDDDGENDATLELVYEGPSGSNEYTYIIAGLSDGAHAKTTLEAAIQKALANDPRFWDKANNKPDLTMASNTLPASFVIDATAPEVEVKFSATERDASGYLDISGTITVKDDNYVPQTDGFLLPFINNGADLALELSYDSDEHQYSFAAFPDGNYTTEALETILKEAIAQNSAFQDEAGNAPNAITLDRTALGSSFAVDTTAPKITVTLTAAAGEGTNYQGIRGTIIVEDVNYEPQTDGVSLSFINDGTIVALKLAYVESPSPGTYKYTIVEFPDGNYVTTDLETTLRKIVVESVAFWDRAGNIPNADTEVTLDLTAWDSSFVVDAIAPVVKVSLLVTGVSENSPNYQTVGGRITVTELNYLTPQPDNTITLNLDEDNDGETDALLELSYDESIIHTRSYAITKLSDGTHTRAGLTTALRNAIVSSSAFQDKAGNVPDVSVDFDFSPGLALGVPFLVDTVAPQVAVSLSATAGDDTHYQGISGEVIVTDVNYEMRETITLLFDDDNKKEITLTLHKATSQPITAGQHRHEFSSTDFLDGAFTRSSLTTALRDAIAGDDAFKDKAGNAPNAENDPQTADVVVNFGPGFVSGEKIIIDTIAPEITVTFEQPAKSDKAYTSDAPWVYYQGISGRVIVEDVNYDLKEVITLSLKDDNSKPITLTLHKAQPQPETLWVDQYQYDFDATDFSDGVFTRDRLIGALQTAIVASDDFKDKTGREPVYITVDSTTVLDPSFVVDTTAPVVEVAFGSPIKNEEEAYAGDRWDYYQALGGTVTVKESNYRLQRDGIRLSFKDSLNNEVTLELSYNPQEQPGSTSEYRYTFTKFPDGNYAKGDLEKALRDVIEDNDVFKDKAGNAPVNNKTNSDDSIALNLDSKTDIARDFVIDSVPLTVDIKFASSVTDSDKDTPTIYQNPRDATAYFQDLAATVTLFDENKLENFDATIACEDFTLIKDSKSSSQGKTRVYTIAFGYGSYTYAEIIDAIQTTLHDKAGNHPDYQDAESDEDDITVNSGPHGFNPDDPIIFDTGDFTFVVDNKVPRPSIISSLSITNTSNNNDDDKANHTEFDPKDNETGYHVYGSTLDTTTGGVSVTLSGSDELAGIQQLAYFKVAVSSITAEDLNTEFDALYQAHGGATLTVDAFDDTAGGALRSSEKDLLTLSYSETYREGDRFIYVLKVVDKAGMVAYYISDGIIVDTFEPAIEETTFATDNLVMTTTVRDGDDPLRLYNGDVTMSIKVSDNNPTLVVNDSASTTAHNALSAIPVSSGLAPSFGWVVTKDEQAVATPAEVPQLVAATEGGIVRSYGGNPTWNDIVAYSQVAQGSFTVSASQNNYNNLRATVTVRDATGNYASETMSPFSIDTTGPTVAVSYDNDNVRNDRYFNARRVATVTVNDHNFLGSGMNIMAPGATLGAWSLSDIDGDMSTYTATVSFSDDGDYMLDIAGTDAATNSIQPAIYQGVATRSFTVDLTSPVLSVAYDNNDVRNGRYYNAARTGTVTVVEHNFGLGEGATVNATRDGAGFSSGGGWAESGDTHTSSIPYSVDGEYTLHVEYTDLAGNPANVVPDDDFTVDLTAPTLEFLGEVQNMRAFNSAEITPLIAFRDQNYDVNGARVTLSRVQQMTSSGTVNPRDTYTLIANGQQVAINAHNSEVGRTSDGIYTLTAAITDLAGNESEGFINYSINRFGSTWYIEPSSATQRMLDAYYTNAPATVEIHEINVNEVQNQQVRFANAGEVTNLLRGQGYTVSYSGADNQWKDYTYKLAASNFVAEGLYEVTIYSEDTAGNTSTNRAPKSDELNPADSLPIDFVVDMTAPSIVLTGAEDNGRYTESERIIKINVEDNLALDTVDVYLNGSVVPSTSFSATDMKDLGNTAEFRVPTSGDFQVLRVSARDMAGNVSDDAVVRNILVNPSPLVQFVRNTPVFAGSIVGVLALVVAVTFFSVLWYRRHKAKER
jgi:hypothetical protein